LGVSSSAIVNETLEILELDNCPLITDASLEQLGKCPSLIQLELYDCQSITKHGIKKFQVFNWIGTFFFVSFKKKFVFSFIE